MSKELEALEKINHTICLAFNDNNKALFNKDSETHIDCKDIYEFIDCYNTIETALKNYEEGLSNAKTYVKHTSSQALFDLLGLALKNVHKSYWKLPEQLYDDVNISLKALKIIKTKEIDIRLFNDCPSLDEYNNWASDESQLTKKEYDLLKEVLL